MDARVAIAVVLVLGCIGALAVGGIVITSQTGHEPPSTLGTIAGTCVGALAMLLVRGDSGSNIRSNVSQILTPGNTK